MGMPMRKTTRRHDALDGGRDMAENRNKSTIGGEQVSPFTRLTDRLTELYGEEDAADLVAPMDAVAGEERPTADEDPADVLRITRRDLTR